MKQPKTPRTRKKRAVTKELSPEAGNEAAEARAMKQKFKAASQGKRSIRCTYDTRLIVPGERTPSGKRYDFLPGAIQQVDPLDYGYLLAMERKQDQAKCCGGAGQNFHYFEGV